MSEPSRDLVDAIHDLVDDPGSECYTLIHWLDQDDVLTTNAPVARALASELRAWGFNVNPIDNHHIDLSEAT